MDNAFGITLRQHRKSKGLTQRKLAELVGVDHTLLSKVENGRSSLRPSEILIRSIAKILEVDPAELILLAEKIPTETREAIARSPSARKLLRRAENLSEAEWKELLRRIPPTRHEALVDATDLELWSVRRDAQALLPLLVRKLVLATASGPCAVAFRTGEGVALPGWDGTVTSKTETNFLPLGDSGWELSTEASIKTKATDDYRRRTKNPLGLQPSKATFVFVTPRRWRDNMAWVAERKTEGVWQEVRVLDADSLETWLSQAPSVHVWISRLLGKMPPGSIDLEGFWLASCELTNPRLTPEILTAGREDAVEKIQKWVRRPEGSIAIHAGSEEEALLVFAAAVHLLPVEEGSLALSRALVVENSDALRTLAMTSRPLILVPRFEPRDELGAALMGGHGVVVPLGPMASHDVGGIVVPRASREAISKAFQAGGVTEAKARELGDRARAGFKTLLRQLAVRPELQAPSWSQPAEGPAVARLMLAGSFSESFKGDRRGLETLTQSTYDEVSRLVVRWSSEADAPVKRVKDAWFFVSKEDAWNLLARYLTADDLERFREVVLEVLGTPDPEFDVPDEERWLARVRGHVPQYSEHLVEGLADTLAIMGARGGSIILGGGSAEDYAVRTVRDLLERANKDWRIWASISRRLSLLAEAAPDAFLTGTEAGTTGATPVLRELFRDKDAGFFGSSPHPGLLWALEMLAWSPAYLGRTSIVLAALARLDPGGTTANRPRNSLAQIYLPWFPQTAATRAQRCQAIDALLLREPEEGWKLLVTILPETHGFAMNAPRPTYRDWAPDGQAGVTMFEYIAAIHDTVTRALDHVGYDTARWVDLIGALSNLPPGDHELIVSALTELDLTRLDGEGPGAIWEALRRLISSHRSFSDAEWALPPDRVEKLEDVWKRFTPTDPVTKYAWLFGPNPELLKPQTIDWEAHERSVEDIRRDAVEDVFSRDEIAGLIAFAVKTEYPYQVGFTFGRSGLMTGGETAFLREHIVSEDSARSQLAHAFAGSRAESKGREWLEALLSDSAGDWTPTQRGALLLCLPCDERTWDLAKNANPETESYYWGRISPFFVPQEVELQRPLRHLLRANRPDAAIALAAREVRGKRAVPTQLVVEVLEDFLRNPPDPSRMDRMLFEHNVGNLLGQFQPSPELSEDRIATLEWAFLPMLRHEHRPPRFLHQKLALDPGFFVEILSLVYRGEGETQKKASKEAQLRARNGHELLDSWRILPGTTAQGSVSSRDLLNWIHTARAAAGEQKRGEIGDQMIGQMLSGSHSGMDGLWPHEAVRDALEDVGSREIEDGLAIGLYNSRGVVSRDPRKGGSQERELAKVHRDAAGAIIAKWPRTGNMLLRIAESYERDARREDQDAELREERYGW